MLWKSVISFSLVFLVILLLVFYIFFPTSKFEIENPENSNFSLGINSGNMQFYENMRYSNSRISYKIEKCALQKENDMRNAFDILASRTALSFYPVLFNEEISVTCDDKEKIEGSMFIAGEGGPLNITKTSNFNVILKGKILLIRESECPTPNIALHELLHSLGFVHSENPQNIMYRISRCNQTIGNDTIDLIDTLYSYPTYPDLSFENVSAVMHGRYLDAEINIRNNGLIKSEKAKVIISSGGSVINEFDLDSLDVGYGRSFVMKNIFVKKLSVDELEFTIDASFNELKKENNKVILKIK